MRGSLPRIMHFGAERRVFARAWTSADRTKADVTSAPPIRMRVGVFILFHS